MNDDVPYFSDEELKATEDMAFREALEDLLESPRDSITITKVPRGTICTYRVCVRDDEAANVYEDADLFNAVMDASIERTFRHDPIPEYPH